MKVYRQISQRGFVSFLLQAEGSSYYKQKNLLITKQKVLLITKQKNLLITKQKVLLVTKQKILLVASGITTIRPVDVADAGCAGPRE